MSRTIEVGRAVLTSSAQHQELWLRTLITISPSQHSIDLEQLSPHIILNLLSSGNVWVGRGHGMRVEIGLTWRGETFPQQELHELVNNIVQAPVWSQLKLKPTIPNDVLLQDGVACVVVSHYDDDGLDARQKAHRAVNNTPAADLSPPDSVANVQFQVVRFSMDILESRQRPQLTRSNTSLVESCSISQQDDPDIEKDLELDMLSHKTTLLDYGVNAETATHPFSPAMVPSKSKRKRSDVRASTRKSPSLVLSFVRDSRKQKLPATITDLPLDALATLSKEQVEEIHILTDAAMRLSICGVSKSFSGIKIKANTFGVCLADVAPALWRPGYLGTLAQRAHLLPTIGRSLVHAAGVRTASVSLGDKLQRLAGYSSGTHQRGGLSSQVPTARTELTRTSSIADSLWLHLQKNLLTRSTPPTQSFVIRNRDTADRSDAEELTHSADCHDRLTNNEKPITVLLNPKVRNDSAYSELPSLYERFRDDHGEARFEVRDTMMSQYDYLVATTMPIIIGRRHETEPNHLCIGTEARASIPEFMPCQIPASKEYTSSLGVSDDGKDAFALSPDQQIAPSSTVLHHYPLADDLLFAEDGEPTE